MPARAGRTEKAMPSCGVTFDPNGGTIDGESASAKVVMYHQKVGKLPVPENGSAAFSGWYTARSGGDMISSDTVITDNTVTFYAHWGYKPSFETDGGSFTSYQESEYPFSDDSSYYIGTLPEVDKYRCEFLGWYSAYVLNIGESKLYASKSCCSQGNVILDNETATESLAAVLSGWGYNTTGNKKPMKSASFYDLLPEGYSVDRSTVFVKPR